MTKKGTKNVNQLKLRNRVAGVFIKRVGSTVYRVSVYFSDTNIETARDKVLRLVKNEAAAGGR